MKSRSFMMFVLGIILAACASWKPVVNTALDVAQYACVIANAEAPSESDIAAICGIANDLIPTIKEVVSTFKAKRSAYAQSLMRANHCSGSGWELSADAGAMDAAPASDAGTSDAAFIQAFDAVSMEKLHKLLPLDGGTKK